MTGYDALHTAIYTALVANTDLTDMLAVYDEVPAIFDQAPQAEDGANLADFPYITFGEGTHIPFDTDTETGQEALIQIDVWSRTGNNEECNLIMDEVANTLHRQELNIVGKHFIGCDLDTSNVSIDPDGITRHGVQRYRILFED